MELQKMLVDERIRCENYKSSYETLKEEHTRLQQEHMRAHADLKELQYDPIRKRVNKMEEEAEKYRSEYNKLQYDFIFLKSKFDHQREEHTQALEEKRICYEAEVCLVRDQDVLAAASLNPARDARRVKALLTDKAQLLVQLLELLESQASMKTVQVEHQSLCLQLGRLEGELQLSHDQNGQVTGRLHRAERAVNTLTCQLESLKHSHKREVDNVKLENVRGREVERERDSLQAQVDDLRTDVEVLLEKERELVRKMQGTCKDELRKTAALHKDKLDLEKRLAELEQQRALQDATGHAQQEEWKERLYSAQQEEQSAHRELQSLKIKLQQQGSQLDRQKAELADLKHENHALGIQLGKLSHSEGELLEMNQRLGGTLDRVREELRTARSQAERDQHKFERQVEERHVEWLKEKHQLQGREAELHQKYSQAKDNLHRAARAQKKTDNREKRLLEAKIAELELEAEEQAQLPWQLREWQRKHIESGTLLLAGLVPSATGPTPLISTPAPFHPRLIPSSEALVSILEEQHQRELPLLHYRPQDLEDTQHLVERDRHTLQG